MVDREKIKDKFVPGYNPIEKGEQIMAKHTATGMKLVLSGPSDRPFADLIQPSKEIFVEGFGEFLTEVSKGFVDGEKEVWGVIHMTLKNYNLSHAAQGQNPMLSEVKTKQQLAYLQKSYEVYKAAKKVVDSIQGKGDGDVEMSEEKEEKKEEAVIEEVKAEAPTPVNASQAIEMKYKAMIEADMKMMQGEDFNDQNALSRAFISTCSFSNRKDLLPDEQKLTQQDYFLDKQKKLASLDPKHEVRELIRKNLITLGGFPQTKVDTIFSENEIEVPADLVNAFLDMQESCLKFRLSEDSDFQVSQAGGTPNIE